MRFNIDCGLGAPVCGVHLPRARLDAGDLYGGDLLLA
jgi:hypothetical protein